MLSLHFAAHRGSEAPFGDIQSTVSNRDYTPITLCFPGLLFRLIDFNKNSSCEREKPYRVSRYPKLSSFDIISLRGSMYLHAPCLLIVSCGILHIFAIRSYLLFCDHVLTNQANFALVSFVCNERKAFKATTKLRFGFLHCFIPIIFMDEGAIDISIHLLYLLSTHID